MSANHFTRSISFPNAMGIDIERWMKMEGVTQFSTAVQILVNRGITCRCRRNNGGGQREQKMLLKESNLKGMNRPFDYFKRKAKGLIAEDAGATT